MLLGIALLVWPGHTAIAATVLIAIDAVIAGLGDVFAGIFSKSMSVEDVSDTFCWASSAWLLV